MNRRRFLAAAGAAASLAGCNRFRGTETPPEPPTPPRVRSPPATTPGEPARPAGTPARGFDRVVDAVEDADCDPSGRTWCDREFRSAVAEDTLVAFPPGRYRFREPQHVGGVERLGVVGEGDVSFVPPAGFNDVLLDVRVGEFLLSNVAVDIRADDTTAGVKVITDDGFLVEDFRYVGRGTHSDPHVATGLFPIVKDPEATGVVRNYVATKGSAWAHYGMGRAGIYVGRLNRGTVRVEDCHLEEFGGPGIYASGTPGNVEVVGGLYRNNNVASIRIGGAGSFVDGARIEVDRAKYTGPRTGEDRAFRLRGVAINQKSAYVDKPPGATVRNCDVRIGEAPSPGPGVMVFGPAKAARVVDTTIRVDADRTPAVHREGRVPFGHHPPSRRDRALHLENVTVTGRAAGAEAVLVEEAPGSVVRNCRVVQPGAGRDGVRLVGSGTTRIEGGTVRTGGYPVVVQAGGPGDGRPDCLVAFAGDPDLRAGVPDGDATPADDPATAIAAEGCLDAASVPGFDGARGERIAVTAVRDATVYGTVLPAEEGSGRASGRPRP